MLSHNGEEKSSDPFSKDGDCQKIFWKNLKTFNYLT